MFDREIYLRSYPQKCDRFLCLIFNSSGYYIIAVLMGYGSVLLCYKFIVYSNDINIFQWSKFDRKNDLFQFYDLLFKQKFLLNRVQSGFYLQQISTIYNGQQYQHDKKRSSAARVDDRS